RPKRVLVSSRPSGRILEGSSVTLNCRSNIFPPVESYTWFRRSGTEDVQISSGQSYRINSISPSDSNKYKCRASNSYGSTFSKYMPLDVVYSPKTVLVSSRPSGRVLAGTSVTLNCRSEANPPVESYTWFKRSGTEDVQTGSGQSYTISYISPSDSNKYKCRASNQHGSAFSEYLPLDVLYSPKTVLVSSRPSGRVLEGTSVTLNCHSEANPPVESYTWFKRSETEDVQTGSGQSYTISYISPSDSNKYKCKASNQHGSAFSEYIGLDVVYGPKTVLVSSSPSGTILEGSSVTLNCRSEANPPVESYTWFRRSGTGDVPTSYGQSYTVDNISPSDSNKYKCRASNQHGSAFSEYMPFDVVYSPKTVLVSSSPSGRVLEGTSVTLNCRSEANPPVESYTWFRRSGTEDVLIGYGQSYTISYISPSDSNKYKCRASNQHGSAFSEYIGLDVVYRPKRVLVSTRTSGRILEGTSVALTCNSDSNPPVESYTWFKRSGSEDVLIGSGQSYTINNISPSDSNKYKCRASNQHGSAFSEYIPLAVLYSPKRTSVSVTLRCSTDANPPVTDYTWFREGESEPVAHGETYSITSITKEDVAPFYCKAGNSIGHSFARPVPVMEECSYPAVGIGGFCGGLVVAVLFTILWLRWGKKQTTKGNNNEAGESRRNKHNTANENDYEVEFQSEAAGFNQFQSEAAGFNQFQSEAAEFNQFQSEAAGYNHFQSEAAGFSQFQSEAAGFNQFQSEAAGFNQFQSEAAGFNQFQSEAAGFNQFQSEAAGFNQFQSEAAGFNQFQSEAAGFNQFQSEAAGFNQFQSEAAGFNQFQSEAAGFNQFQSEAAGFNQFQSEAAGFNQFQSEAAVH
ncbi:hypothetical protein NFI96_025974, partial [Prochilodus magdalenae]